MPRIGIVLSGGMSRGAYEIGCVKAIADRFGRENICCISASSVGVLCGYAYATQKLDELIDVWKHLDMIGQGNTFVGLVKSPELIQRARNMASKEDTFSCPMYSTIWNFTNRTAEYVALNEVDIAARADYLQASIAVPVVTKSVKIGNDICMDGAFIDNIPVYPMLEKNLDYIFCIYFEEKNYLFENNAFDKKVIKLNRFPSKGRLDLFVYDSGAVDEMIQYGYDYANRIMNMVFSAEDTEETYRHIKELNAAAPQPQKRVTTDFVLNNIAKAVARLSKRKIL